MQQNAPEPVDQPNEKHRAKSSGNEVDPRAKKRKKAVRRRLRRRFILWGAGVIAAAIAGGVLTFFNTIGQSTASRILGGAGSSASATTARSAHGSLDPTRGYMVAVDFEYPPGQRFALPQALTDGAEAAPLRAGFADPTIGMTDFLRINGGAAVKDLDARLVFTGTTDRTIHILSVQVLMMATGPNLDGTAINTSSGSTDSTLPVDVDLDTPGRAFSQNGLDFFADHEIKVSSADSQSIDAHFTSTKHAYRWLIAIRSVDLTGKTITSYLDAKGNLHDAPSAAAKAQWFALSGPASRYQTTYLDDYETGGRGFHVKS